MPTQATDSSSSSTHSSDSERASGPVDGRRRVMIERVTPCVDEGRFMSKRVVGEAVVVEADVFADGHDAIRAVVRHRQAGETTWREAEMRLGVNDRWRAVFHAEHEGVCEFTIEAWIDRFGSWRRDLVKRAEARQVSDVDLLQGAILLEELVDRATGEAASRLARAARGLRESSTSIAERTAEALDETIADDARRRRRPRASSSWP